MGRRSLSASRAHGVDGAAERTVLGSDHPLLRATKAVHYEARQWVHVAAVLTGSVIARIEGREWAGLLAGSAAIVLLVLTVLIAAHKQRERDCAIELILEGREAAPIAAVQRQRRRLLAERTRNGLAGCLEDLIGQAASRSRLQMRVTPLPYDPTVLKMAAGELRDVIELLRIEGGVCPRRRASRAIGRARDLAPVRGRRRCAARGAVPGARPAGERRWVICEPYA